MDQPDRRSSGIGRILIIAAACLIVLPSGPVAAQQPAQAPGPCSRSPFSSLREQLLKLSPAEARTVTEFLAGGGESQVALHEKVDEHSIVRIFETNGLDHDTFLSLREPFVLSVQPTPDKLIDQYNKDNSVLVQFVVPEHDFPLWKRRSFAVVACTKDDSKVAAWGMALARVSYPPAVAIVCIAALALVYVLAALAVAAISNRDRPLAAKWPEFAAARKFSFWEYLDPVRLTADVFNRASVQKLQILLFSFLIAGMLLALALMRGHLSDLSATVLGLLGISGVGAAAAQATHTTRSRLDFKNWAWLVRRHILPINEEDRAGPRWGDLVLTNREFDIYKAQTLVFSLVVALALLINGGERLASFTVPDALLGILGLSQIVYVGGVLARPASIGDLDDALTELRKREAVLQTAVAYGLDSDADGKLPDLKRPDPMPPLDTRKTNAVIAGQRYREQARQVALMIESTIEVAVDPDKGPDGGLAADLSGL
jgi:hypothetical protein